MTSQATNAIEHLEHRHNKVWKTVTYDMNNPADIAKYFIRYPYVWPGGYARVAIADDYGVLCAKCCKENFREIAASNPKDGWHLETLFVNWEDSTLYCDNCGEDIPAEYSDD